MSAPPLTPQPAAAPEPEPRHEPSIENLLLRFGLVTLDQLGAAMREQTETGVPFTELLVRDGIVSADDLERVQERAPAPPPPPPAEPEPAPEAEPEPELLPAATFASRDESSQSPGAVTFPQVPPELEEPPAAFFSDAHDEPGVHDDLGAHDVPGARDELSRSPFVAPVSELAPEPQPEPEPAPEPPAMEQVAPAPAPPLPTTDTAFRAPELRDESSQAPEAAAPGPPPPAAPEPEPLPQVPAVVTGYVVRGRLVNGEEIEIASVDRASDAQRIARDAMRACARSSGADWPILNGRYVRPESIVSIEVAELHA